MTLSIAVPDELETTLRDRASAEGKDVPTFVRETLEEKLRRPKRLPKYWRPSTASLPTPGFIKMSHGPL